MKYVKQLIIIFLFSFIGEILNYFIPLSIPSSIYGMILLFLTLNFKIIKIEDVSDTAEYLLKIMLIFFVPSAVGIMDTFFKYQSFMLSIVIIVFISTIIVMSTTGLISQFMIKITNKKKGKKHE